MKCVSRKLDLCAALRVLLATSLLGSSCVWAAPSAKDEPVAQVGSTVITNEAYQRALHIAARRTFYHGKIPPGRLAQLQRNVVNQLIDDLLLLEEAKRRGVVADAQAVDASLAKIDERNRDKPEWQRQRANAIPQLRNQFERTNILKQLQDRVRAVPEPGLAAVRSFYVANPSTFTEPERARVSAILLRVDPSSPTAAWDGAQRDGAKLVARLHAGDSFAQAASLHSADRSADKGGDLGYVHRGMLAKPAQEALDQLKPGQISEPVRVLQGVLIVQLVDRQRARLLPFSRVAARATRLLHRTQGDAAWAQLRESLRARTKVALNESRLLPLESQGQGGRRPSPPGVRQ